MKIKATRQEFFNIYQIFSQIKKSRVNLLIYKWVRNNLIILTPRIKKWLNKINELQENQEHKQLVEYLNEIVEINLFTIEIQNLQGMSIKQIEMDNLKKYSIVYDFEKKENV